MSDPRHVRIAEQLVGYALNELRADERQDVEAHLRTCAICSNELREILESMALVGGTTSATPPASLKDRVLSSIAVQPQEPGSARTFGSQPNPQRFRWLALAAAILIVALAGALYVVDSSRRGLAGRARQVAAELIDLRERLQRYSAQTDLALSILTASDMRELALAGRENATATAARAYWSPTRGLLVVADQLPAAPPGRAYQVWIIESGQPLSAGMLDEPAPGRGMLVAPPPRQGIGSTVTIAVTDEPPGGLTTPSGQIRLAASI